MNIKITNNSGFDLDISTLMFEYFAIWDAGAQSVEVSYAYGSLDDASDTLLTTVATPGASGGTKLQDYPDYSVNLQSFLTDYTLANGEVAVFSLTGTNAVNTGVNGIVDNILLTGSVSTTSTASFQVSPSVLVGSVDDASAVITNSFEVSYLAGVPATNMNVSSISVVNESTAGFSVSPGSLTLTVPSPSQEVEVVFDNNMAGLVVSEAATCDVQILWNEMGSAVVSTSTVSVSVSYPDIVIDDSNILAVFDSDFTTADRFVYGLDTGLSGGKGRSSWGSTDTSYGTLLGEAPADAVAMLVSVNDSNVVVAVTNNTANDATFDSLHFDIGYRWDTGPARVNVSISGDISNDSSITNCTGFTRLESPLADFDDFDVDLTGLVDRTLTVGEVAIFTFTFSEPTDTSNADAVSAIDNIALIGSGTTALIPATITRVSRDPQEVFNVSGLDMTTGIQLIDLRFEVGELNVSNVTITGISFTDETYPGSMSATGAFPVTLSTPSVTNSAVFGLVFDNTVANLAAGESASARVVVEFNEPGNGSCTDSFIASIIRPAVATSGVIARFDTQLTGADAAYNGVLGRFTGGNARYVGKGSTDETYGSLVAPAAPTELVSWVFDGYHPEVALTITNETVAAIELSSFNFDIGLWFPAATEFTLSISGDVTADSSSFDLGALGYNNYDYEDHDVDLTGLLDHTLAAGESITFTFTLGEMPESALYNGTWIDNVILMGAVDVFGGWMDSKGLTSGVNDDPNDNPDSDGMDNLMEYATGGDPLVADGPVATLWQSEEGGTNWFYHVHAERLDDDSLTYSVGAKGDLQLDPSWDTAEVEAMGESIGPGEFKTVTNRTDMGSTVKFMNLTVEQD